MRLMILAALATSLAACGAQASTPRDEDVSRGFLRYMQQQTVTLGDGSIAARCSDAFTFQDIVVGDRMQKSSTTANVEITFTATATKSLGHNIRDCFGFGYSQSFVPVGQSARFRMMVGMEKWESGWRMRRAVF